MPCPPTLLDPPTTDAAPLTVDVAVVGAGATGAAAAWHLARRGLRVVLLERRSAGAVWRAAGPGPWTDAGLPAPLAAEAGLLWRQVEQATGATLLQAGGGGWQVRADHATAALTAAATAWGAVLRHCDEVVALAGVGSAVQIRTRTAALRADRVLLAGSGPAALSPDPTARVATLPTAGCFAIPALSVRWTNGTSVQTYRTRVPFVR